MVSVIDVIFLFVIKLSNFGFPTWISFSSSSFFIRHFTYSLILHFESHAAFRSQGKQQGADAVTRFALDGLISAGENMSCSQSKR